MIANGATQILVDAFGAFIEEGDETILFEPVFEFYYQQNELFGGKSRYFPMDPPKSGQNEWKIDFKALRKCFTKHTKMIVLNTPQNPVGKMYTEEDIHEFVQILKDFPNCIVLSDEVQGLSHPPILYRYLGVRICFIRWEEASQNRSSSRHVGENTVNLQCREDVFLYWLAPRIRSRS